MLSARQIDNDERRSILTRFAVDDPPRSKGMSTDPLLARLDADGIENLWIVYHDYGGRSCAKTVPKEKFASALERGVVFARANLSMRFDDHQPADATFLADTGDFLAVPDPGTYARVPWQPATASP